ncbi:tRNA pseudouridine(55) synthase TruB [Aquisphaera giovannonii]|uniref:tRNA pseudouridine(55) synthase TruB n=1 Tax=Aquisphaera giovannonii TaxID=406548 RepID=UPI001FE6555A|nr:tRNA pseudouridine(55) synthase TruB [Aquisphaera giovannonii]
MKGILNLNKPVGVSSRAIVDRVVRLLPRAKLGHAGTLDPLASGVLVVGVGQGTRLVESIQAMAKTYRATIRLGGRSDTLDADGTVAWEDDPRIPTSAEVDAALATQVGTILQQPPAYSALRVGGRRAYDLARAGQAAELAPRPVRIDRVERLPYEWPRLDIEVDCGGGTYIRSIARDVGEALGCGGFIEVLRRTRIGPFAIEDALDPDALAAETIGAAMLPLLAAVPHLPAIPLDDVQLGLVARGRPLDAARLSVRPPSTGEVALVAPDGSLAAIAEVDPAAGAVRPRKVVM